MCIYCGTNKYRKIYENHYGPIPKDEFGRTYEIHHIDGNHFNNHPNNLKSVSIQEHYDIHYSQGDWAACSIMLDRMKISPEEKSKLASKFAFARVKDGTHPFLGGKIQRESNLTRVKNGTHNFLDGTISSITQKKLVENGTHHLLNGEIQKVSQRKLVENGTHHLLSGEIQRNAYLKRVKDGTQELINKSISERQKKKLEDKTHIFLQTEQCPHCGKKGQKINLLRWHFSKCKNKIN